MKSFNFYNLDLVLSKSNYLLFFFLLFIAIIFVAKYLLLRKKYTRNENIPFCEGNLFYFSKSDFFIDINVKNMDYPRNLIRKISPLFNLEDIEDYATISASKFKGENIRVYFICINDYIKNLEKNILELRKIYKKYKLIPDPWIFLYLISTKPELKNKREVKCLFKDNKITKNYFIFSFCEASILKQRKKESTKDVGYLNSKYPVYIMGIKK